MKPQLLKRRELLWRLAQSTLGLSILGRASQVLATAAEKPGKSILVLGAGLSGLYSALLLEAQGFEVTILEARKRVGGRVFTLDDLPGKPEAGGQSFNEQYSRLLSLAQQLDVPVKTPQKPNSELLLYINELAVLPSGWSKSPANQLAGAERNLIPPALMTYYLRSQNPLQQKTDWVKADYEQWDIPLDKYLKNQGASTEALRLMNIYPLSMNSIDTASTLWALRHDWHSQNLAKNWLQIKGGNSRFPEKLAANLRATIDLEKVVEAIDSQEQKVKVYCRDGSDYESDYVICTIPFSVLRQIEIKPSLQGSQQEAVNHLPYTRVTQVYLQVHQPFWEVDNYPLRMWTDTFLELIFPLKNEHGQVTGLVCWANGVNADKLAALNPQQLERTVISQLAKMRPATKGNIKISRVVTWGADPFSLGAYAHFAPGQIREFKSQMTKPWHRIYFAGEHTATLSIGMESALESAERVVAEVVASNSQR